MAPDLPGGGHSVVVSDLAEAGRRRAAADRGERPAGRSTCSSPTPACPGSGPARGLQRRRGRPRGPGQPRGADDLLARALLPAMSRARAATSSSSPRSPARPPPPRLDLQRDQVRPPRLRARRSARTSSAIGRRRRLGRPARIHPRRRHVRRRRERSSRRGSGPRRPEAVADGVVKAIERNRAEVAVAPPQQRALVVFAHIFPVPRGPCPARLGARRSPSELARGQADKR